MGLGFLKKDTTLGKNGERTDFRVFWWDERMKEDWGFLAQQMKMEWNFRPKIVWEWKVWYTPFFLPRMSKQNVVIQG